jgi:dihydrodipicolinate synthase/N-acetylneuraminate lyase
MALPYTRGEIKERARSEWRGLCNVTLPSFNSDFSGLNEAGIAHDVRHARELGYWGTLVASECGTTLEEYERFLEVAAEAANGELKVVAHLSFNTAEETLRAARTAEDVGAEAGLLSYPPGFRPSSPSEIVGYTRELTDVIDLAIVAFGATTWGFTGHPAGFPIDALEEIVKLETVAALKYEGGGPALFSAFDEVFHRCGEHAIVENPMELHTPALIRNYGIPWFGTSGYEALGSRPVEVYEAASAGDFTRAMEIFWSSAPARAAKGQFHATFVGAHLIHRVGWKYLGWLQGFNGGLLRMPQMRLIPPQMKALRAGVVAAGFDVPDDDAEFYAGRVTEASVA